MEGLRLPVVKEITQRQRRISMDDYLRFVMDNLKYIVSIDLVRKVKKKNFVNVPFILK